MFPFLVLPVKWNDYITIFSKPGTCAENVFKVKKKKYDVSKIMCYLKFK